MSKVISVIGVEHKIFFIRGQKVMVDRHLAELYEVPTSRLNQQVKRNIKRFPSDFMFQLTPEELKNWMSQIAISNKERMGLRKLPYAFTEQGVAMLSSVLNSERSIEVNIAIMRAFVKIREVLATHKELVDRLSQLEKRMGRKDQEVIALFEAIRKLIAPEPEKRKRPISIFSTAQKISNPYGGRSFDFPVRKMLTLNKAPSLLGVGFIVEGEVD